MLGFQNTSPFEDDLALVEVFHALGVRIAQLTYNTQNHVGRSCAARGCYLEFDTFGQETWVYPFGAVDRLSDAQRVDLIRDLVAEGLTRQVLVSHDIGYKHRLARYGGSGYGHLLTTVLPHPDAEEAVRGTDPGDPGGEPGARPVARLS